MTGELFTRVSGLEETADDVVVLSAWETAGGLGVRHQRWDIAGTVHHAHDLDAVGDLAVQDKVPPDRKIAKVRRNVGPCRAKARLVGEKQELLLDVVKHAVGGARVVIGDVKPDVDQVFLGLGRALDRRHDPSRARCLSVLRRNEPPPGLGLDRRHIGMTPRSTC